MWSSVFRPYSIALGFVLATWTAPYTWALTATPTSLTFQAVQGGTNPAGQSVTVSKSNNKTTNWTASDSATWLSVTPLTGNITGTAQVGVSVNTAGLAAGTYSATVTVTVYKGGNISIPVSLTVAPATSTSSMTSTSTTTSSTASLSWDPSTSTVAGYRVYMGTASGVYGLPVNVGNVTSYSVGNLAVGYTYYFAVTCYDANGVESSPSSEVSKIIY